MEMEIKTKTAPHCSFAHDEQVFVELFPEKCSLIGRNTKLSAVTYMALNPPQ